MDTLAEQLLPYAERFTLEEILSEYRVRCLAQKQAYLPPEKKILFTLIVLISFFVGLEVLSRIFLLAYPPQSPVFSNLSSLKTPSLLQQVEIAPKNKMRIVCMGDSVTLGLGVAENKTFSALLAQKLPDYEVINGGHPGWTLKNWQEEAEQIARLKPISVLLCLGWEDLLQMSRKLDWNQIPSHSVLHHSALIQILQKAKWSFSSVETQEKTVRDLFLQRPLKKFHPQQVFQKQIQSLQECFLFFKEQNISVYFCALPQYFSHPKVLEKNAVLQSVDLIRFSDWSFENWQKLLKLFNHSLSEFAQKESVEMVSFSDIFFDPADFLDFRHLTEQGHQKMAEAIFQESSSKKWWKIR